MTLNSFAFIFFLPLVVGINFMLPRKYRYLWLCAASLFFYLSIDVRFGLGLLFCTATTYATGRLLEKVKENRKKLLLFLCILGNVAVLLLFRYSSLQNIFVPIGMSFYALQGMGYVIDVYRGNFPAEQNPVKYTLFVSFFPTVMSGPIQRGRVLLEQINEGREFQYEKARRGLYDLLRGYLLKIVIANPLGEMVDYAYASYDTMPGATLLWATVLYAIQLYCDFAGYSALAVGAAKILGFDIADNFAQPYFAASIKDFWRRWHISLSSWLRDYVYISLGGNRKGKGRKYRNLMLTFLVSGVWHGSGVNFLVWGALHGGYQILESCLEKPKDEKRIEKWTDKQSGKKNAGGKLWYQAFRMVRTFLLVDFAWLFFRASSLEQALTILYRIVFCFELKEMTYYGSYLLGVSKWELLFMLVCVVALFLVDWLHEKGRTLEGLTACRVITAIDEGDAIQVPRKSLPVVGSFAVLRWSAYIALTLLILLTIVRNYGQAASTFIYARF